jgi:uncharacterized membrane protein (UPF0127 family)
VKRARLIIDGTPADIDVLVTQRARERMRGLLGRASLAANEALLLSPCRSIHTFGMRFAIDVLFVDRHGRVVTIHRGVPRARLLFSLRGVKALEMAAGAARACSIEVGNVLGFEVDA